MYLKKLKRSFESFMCFGTYHTTRMSCYQRVISDFFLYDFNACNNVRYILYNTDIINSIVKLIVHSPVGKLV